MNSTQTPETMKSTENQVVTKTIKKIQCFEVIYRTIKNVRRREFWQKSTLVRASTKESALLVFNHSFKPDIKKFDMIETIKEIWI